MSTITIRTLALPLAVAAALLGAAAGADPGRAADPDPTAVSHGWPGGCWNKPVLPDWCEFRGAYRSGTTAVAQAGDPV